MKVGCGEWGFRELEFERHIEIVRSFGFHTLEFGIGGDFPGRLSPAMSDQEIAAFHELKERSGISMPFACLENDFTLPDAKQHEQVLNRTLDQIDLAHRLGATHVRLFAGFTPVEEMTMDIWQRLITALESCSALTRKLGSTVAIETHGRITSYDGAAYHQHTATTDRSWLQRLVNLLPPGVRINYDPGNLKAVAPDDHTYNLDVVNPYINYCHLKDWRRRGGGWEAVAIGDSDLDYAKLLPQISFDGIFLIEYEPTADVEDGIRRSLSYLTKIGQQVELA